MYAVRQPLAASSSGDVMGVPAWKSLPTWYLAAANDEAIRRRLIHPRRLTRR